MPKMIHIVHTDDGKIIAASESKHHARVHGAKVGEFAVPAKFEDKKIHEYIPLLEVDIKAGHLKEKK